MRSPAAGRQGDIGVVGARQLVRRLVDPVLHAGRVTAREPGGCAGTVPVGVAFVVALVVRLGDQLRAVLLPTLLILAVLALLGALARRLHRLGFGDVPLGVRRLVGVSNALVHKK